VDPLTRQRLPRHGPGRPAHEGATQTVCVPGLGGEVTMPQIDEATIGAD
jgi:hypothetical protein